MQHQSLTLETKQIRDSPCRIFFADFPLKRGLNKTELLRECLNWVIDSPHTEISQEEISKLYEASEFELTKGQEALELDSACCPEYEVASFRYIKTNEKFKCETTISFILMSASKETWVGVKATCASKEVSIETPQVKKPVIIIRLLDRFGGGLDNDIYVGHDPILLDPDESGKDLAANLISGTEKCRPPIVYVSCYHNGRHAVIPERLARKLSGLAHVVVEPSREFSFKIRKKSRLEMSMVVS